VALGLGFALALLITGVIAGAVGVVTCTQEDGSSEQAPHLCEALGNKHAFLYFILVAPAVVQGLSFLPISRRVLAIAGMSLLGAHAVVFTMWALVAHGTITY
jgi:hypothetical protein